MKIHDGIAFELWPTGKDRTTSWKLRFAVSQDYGALLTKGRSVDFTFLKLTGFAQECSCGCGAQTIGIMAGVLGVEVLLSFGLWKQGADKLPLNDGDRVLISFNELMKRIAAANKQKPKDKGDKEKKE